MNRIITDSYVNSLNTLIDKYEISPALTSLVDFFTEEVKKDQNRKANRNQKIFSDKEKEKLNEIKDSEDLRRIYAYINVIIEAFIGKYLHIHLNVDLSENVSNNLTTLITWEALVNASYDKDFLDKEINLLKKETERDLIMPYDNNGHLKNQIFRKSVGLEHKLKFLKKIKSIQESNLNTGVLLNLNTSANSSINLSEYSICPESLNTFLNFGYSRKDIFKEMGREKVERLSMIINLFPSMTGKNIWYKDFMSDEINRYNNFKKIITITSGEKTPESLLEMQKQKKFQAEEIYTIFSFEL
jgi:hypothetical protein